MANDLSTVAEKFTSRLDEILVHESKTADLTANQDLVGDFAGVGKVQVAMMELSGLGDYNRANGFPEGDINLDWEVVELKNDRAREFSIDVMDDEERELVVSANVMAQFVRTRVIPEVDAIRFAKLTASANGSANGAIDKTNVEQAILDGEAAIAEYADLDGSIIYMTQAVKNALRQALPYRIGQGEDPNGTFETLDDMKVVTVPQNRFYSAIDLYDGAASGEEAGGYDKHASTGGSDTAGKDINFIIVNPQACAAISKHETLRYFAPEVNQAKDAHKWQYRLYHDLFVFSGKSAAVYAHTK